ncbi:methylmalonyl-CoA mutase family protein [Neobacillus sp. PS3-34]|uniref:methylmalonyl-CoA mutase family protein n=1 Tax=Neobacillus sp. PS3-34 TaxID=3070678 RepID=UPI0027E1EFBC|nr:methylmalonyl-CoA mutase family protein [Neobacillus sp. PS3-34]WML47583.1 methylmalonyl-CoA mutase family protein [Neobacillus sp. PS3-34]
MSLERGQTALSFELKPDFFEQKNELAESLKEFYAHYPFAVNAKELQAVFLSELAIQAKAVGRADQVTGYIGYDPLSVMAENGCLPVDPAQFFSDWKKDLTFVHENLSFLRTILINTSSYHNGGANAVQELAIALAEGAFYLQELQENDLELDVILSKMIFQFSIGANFFMEIAKLRAARLLWDKITKAYGAASELRGMHISAETSAFTKTVYDPHVNILRAGNEAFAAALGGVQYLHVRPFDELSGATPFSERVARNTQLILQEETHLQAVTDPAGGSLYIEELTKELAKKAWELFLQIDLQGGMLEVLKSGWLQKEISTVAEKRKQDIFTRKQSIIGTNVYANSEKESNMKFFIKNKGDAVIKNSFPGGHVNIQPIKLERLAEPFEELRKKAEQISKQKGVNPCLGLICLGELKQHKPRLDFITGFVSAGGIEALKSEPIHSLDSARKFVSGSAASQFCLCGQNEQYEESGLEILKVLKTEFPNFHFYLAGLPEKQEQAKWTAEGIKQFIHIKSNCYDILSSMLAEMEADSQ